MYQGIYTLHHVVVRVVHSASCVILQCARSTLLGSRSLLHVHDRYKSANKVTAGQSDIEAVIEQAAQCATVRQSVEHVIPRAEWRESLVT